MGVLLKAHDIETGTDGETVTLTARDAKRMPVWKWELVIAGEPLHKVMKMQTRPPNFLYNYEEVREVEALWQKRFQEHTGKDTDNPQERYPWLGRGDLPSNGTKRDGSEEAELP